MGIPIQPIDPASWAALGRTAWSGVYPGDELASGYIAVSATRGLPLGVLAWWLPQEGGTKRTFIFSMNPRTRQRLVIAEALAEYLPTGAWPQRNWLDADSPECAALLRRGWQIADEGCYYEIPYERVEARLSRLETVLERKRPLRAGQQVTSWLPEHRLEVRRIAQAEHLADITWLDTLLSGGRPPSLCPAATSVALDQGRLVGFFLSVIEGDRCEAPVRWVAPSHRNSWVNARLMLHSLRHGRPHHPEVTRLRFKGDVHTHQETHALCQRFGGAMVARSLRLASPAKALTDY